MMFEGDAVDIRKAEIDLTIKRHGQSKDLRHG